MRSREIAASFCFAADIGILEPPLDNGRCLGVSSQALAVAATQHKHATHLELAGVPLLYGIGETSISEARIQDLTNELASIVFAGEGRFGNRNLKHADIAAGGAVVEQVLPIAAQFGQRRLASDAFAPFILNRQFPAARGVAHHCRRPSAATIGGKLDHRRLASARQRREPDWHRSSGPSAP